MKTTKALNLKNMKETYINFTGTKEDMELVWKNFYQLECMGFISRELWIKFAEQCKGWYITEDQSEVRDSTRDDELVWRYTSDEWYTA